MGTVRLVATDLDGTLLGPDGRVSSRTRLALEQVQTAGIEVVLVTGRPPRTLLPIARDLGATGQAICCNGAITYDLADEVVTHHRPLSLDLAHRFIGALRALAPGVCFAAEMELEFGCEPEYAVLRPLVARNVVQPLEALALCRAPVTKLIVQHPTLAIEALWPLTREVIGAAAVATHSGAGFVEIAAAGVDKAQALAALCAGRGIDRSAVIAFGDMPNDLAMLAWAGHGVAVANAHPDVLAQADATTLSNAEDGVALVLERLVP
jgi:Cof subfamily protein (haloacid dehalogenase superfamily)